jgi:NADH-quinone oxidoreductase subunit I
MYYFRNIYRAIRTVAAGLKVTLPYHFARTVVVQYPDVEPTLQPRYRGFHSYQIERCIACEACAKACPVGAIRVAKSGPRKIDKARDLAVGGAITQYQIDYTTCLFCGLCTEVCPTECLKMGSIHDNSCYCREELVTDFVRLAKQGRRTVEPICPPGPPGSAISGGMSMRTDANGCRGRTIRSIVPHWPSRQPRLRKEPRDRIHAFCY